MSAKNIKKKKIPRFKLKKKSKVQVKKKAQIKNSNHEVRLLWKGTARDGQNFRDGPQGTVGLLILIPVNSQRFHPRFTTAELTTPFLCIDSRHFNCYIVNILYIISLRFQLKLPFS